MPLQERARRRLLRFVLVRGALDPFVNVPAGPRWRVRGKTAKYTLFEKDPNGALVPPGGALDDGPCANGLPPEQR
ncbi:MAG TPA: hypothetical protein VM580_13825 [Labilithrix sp.]|nr:hypothetical protein [Labilithrix sp.]